MKNIKIEFEYSGSKFYGYQKQKKEDNRRTVQGELEKTISKIIGSSIKTVASGRTDKGVHAINQVANFLCDTKIPIEKLKQIINNVLPKDILIKNLEEVSIDFNARFSANSRSYIYKVKEKKNYNVFECDYFTYIENKLDAEKIIEIAKPLIGVHNFESFRMSDCNAKNPIREILDFKFYIENDTMVFYIRANAFLKSMVRIIIGSILSIYEEKNDSNYIIDKLKSPNRYCDKILAPPQGLYLYEVDY